MLRYKQINNLKPSILPWLKTPHIRNYHGANKNIMRSMINSPLKFGINGLIIKRNISFIKYLRIPGYIGGTVAAGGSYVAYKLDQVGNYTFDQIDKFKDFAGNLFNKGSEFFNNSDGNIPNGGESGGSGGGDGDTTAALATAAAVAVSSDQENEDDDEDDDDDTEVEREESDEIDDNETNHQMLNLTKQMIEIRNILSTIDSTNSLKLPSIVVIGSQSSGKSSVLESIVGHEFLPKGDNMVTKRPIELTLVNDNNLTSEVIEFPSLKMAINDFKQAQKILVDLNLAVPTTDYVSEEPIQVTIRSSKVPDLSLVDLPGYIQVESYDQPPELKAKIRSLCNRYLENPNIILAILAANVDLANSTALRAARIADPKGERTLGVITKLDLVEPELVSQILNNKKYPLKMGYVGVITKIPQSNSNFLTRKNLNSVQSYLSQQIFESSYLKTHQSKFLHCNVGTKILKFKLIKVLEKSMIENLAPTHLMIQKEFEETNYKFKVEYNDIPLTPSIYLANNIDILKLSVKELSSNFTKRELKSVLKSELDQKILNILSTEYWNDDKINEITNAKFEAYWERKLDNVCQVLTKLGIGRLSTTLTTNILVQEVDNLISTTQLKNHPNTRKAVLEVAKQILGNKYYSTADQVENCIKPFKYEIEIEDREWQASRDKAINLMREEIKNCDELFHSLKNQVGGRKLNQVMKYLKNLGDNVDYSLIETLGFLNSLINKAKLGVFLNERLSILKMRYQFLKNSGKCKRKENKNVCPEIYMDVINSKITNTSVLFLNVELLNDFYYNFPRELDARFFNNEDEMEKLAMEDDKVRVHIELQKRKDLLGLALSRIEGIMAVRKYGH